MKKIYASLILILSLSFLALGNPQIGSQDPKIGDVLIITKNKGETYQYINVPRLNILVKRGGIASYKSIYNTEVTITEVLENEYGQVYVKLERKDGKKFFNQKKWLKANYDKALSSGELKIKS